MSDLLTALGRFVSRDIIYVIGGTAIILSALYLAEKLPQCAMPTGYYVIGAGFAYVLGYTVQEGVSLIPLLRLNATQPVLKVSSLTKWLYHKHTGGEWKVQTEWIATDDAVDRDKYGDAVNYIHEHASPRHIELLERTIAVKQIGTTGGPCALVSAALIFARVICVNDERGGVDLWLSLALLLVGLLLLGLGWIKGAMQTQTTMRLAEWLEKNPRANEEANS